MSASPGFKVIVSRTALYEPFVEFDSELVLFESGMNMSVPKS